MLVSRYLAVAKPTKSLLDFPKACDIVVFEIPGNLIIKLNAAVWHAGPFFEGTDSMDFMSLELSDTNVEDHNTHSYAQKNIIFHISPTNA